MCHHKLDFQFEYVHDPQELKLLVGSANAGVSCLQARICSPRFKSSFMAFSGGLDVRDQYHMHTILVVMQQDDMLSRI